MNKQEKIDLKEKLENNFISDFSLEYLSQEEQAQAIKTAYITTKLQLKIGETNTAEYMTTFSVASACMQNFHILKAINENNEKLDTIIDLLSKK